MSPARASLAGLPVLRVDVGDVEVSRDQAAALVERARAAKTDARLTEWPGGVHGFWMLAPTFPTAAVFERLGEDVAAMLG